jgi:hypothetical protein
VQHDFTHRDFIQLFRSLAESTRGIAPRVPHRTGHDTLASSGSCHSVKAAAFHRNQRAPPVSCRPIDLDASDLPPLLCGHYPASSLIRSSPPQCFASVLSPRGFRHLCFSLGIETTGSCSSAKKPASASRPLYAGRHLSSHQAPDRLIPEGPYASGFDDIRIFNDACSVGSLAFVSRTHTCSRSFLELCLQR